MALSIQIPADIEQRLRAEALRQNATVDTLAIRLLANYLPEVDRVNDAVTMLLDWAKQAEDLSEEEARSNTELLQSLDQHRSSNRPLFHHGNGPKT